MFRPPSETSMGKMLAVAVPAVLAIAAAAGPRLPRDQGRARHVRLDGVPAMTPEGSGIFKKNGSTSRSDDSAEGRHWRSHRATSSARRRRSRPGSSGTRAVSRRSRSSRWTRATARTDGRSHNVSKIADLKGKTVAGRRRAPRVFHAPWFLRRTGFGRIHGL